MLISDDVITDRLAAEFLKKPERLHYSNVTEREAIVLELISPAAAMDLSKNV